jgi:hypothetical protein
MISARTVNIYGFVSIAVMAVLLALIVFEQVSRSMYVPFFIVAAVLFAIRIVLRVLLARQQRKARAVQSPPDTPAT